MTQGWENPRVAHGVQGAKATLLNGQCSGIATRRISPKFRRQNGR